MSQYYEADERRKAKGKKSSKSEDVSPDEMGDQAKTKNSPLSDDELRHAISDSLTVAERRRIKDAAYTLKRSYTELSTLRAEGDWVRISELLNEDYRIGQFLIDNLGADRYVEPRIAMTLLLIRNKMIEDMQIESAAEFMLMDGALTAHYNSIKLQTMLGDLLTQIERDMFHDESMSVNLKRTGNLEVENFKIEAMLNRASDKLMTLIERTNMTMVRNIKALRDLKIGNLSIRADQVKIAQQQLHDGVNGNRKTRPIRTKNSPGLRRPNRNPMSPHIANERFSDI